MKGPSIRLDVSNAGETERERERELAILAQVVRRGSPLGVRSAPALWVRGASLRAWGWTRARAGAA